MTNPRKSQIAELRDELHCYHIEVRESLASIKMNCDHCHKQYDNIGLLLYGMTPPSEVSPGLVVRVDDLERTRRIARRVVKIVWVVTLGLATVCATGWGAISAMGIVK